MSLLKFRSRFVSPRLKYVDLPVEIRRQNLSLVARTLLSRTIELDPGRYHVTATLPSGEQLYQAVEVGATEITVTLSPYPDEHTGPELPEASIFLRKRRRSKAVTHWAQSPSPLIDGTGRLRTRSKLRRFEGNVLRGPIEAVEFTAPANPYASQVVQLVQPPLSPLNVRLPTSPDSSAEVSLEKDNLGILDLDVRLGSPDADVLLKYLDYGELQLAATTAMSPCLQAERLLGDKERDPIAAATGAYALLRVGDLERLHDWTRNLMNWFEWLPDGLVIYAEHLARLGEHQASCRLLLDLPQRGLPIFTDGFSFAIDRLRLYTQSVSLPREDRTEAAAVLDRLQPFAAHADFEAPFVTFTGLDPMRPSATPFLGDLDDIEGTEIYADVGSLQRESNSQ